MPELKITCDGCGEKAKFKDLADLYARRGFCSDVCNTRYTRDSFKKPRSDGWNQIDGARLARRGKREDLGDAIFRSAMEANVARFFNAANITWEYEPKMFVFPGEIYAPVNYRPDFYVLDNKRRYWVEVKGRWSAHDRQKLRKFKKHCPQEFSQLWVICKWSKGTRGREEQRLLKGVSPSMRITDWKQIVSIRCLIQNWE
jgi:hypothetical protein